MSDVKSPVSPAMASAGGGGGGAGTGRRQARGGQTPASLDFFQQPRLVATNCVSCKKTLMGAPAAAAAAANSAPGAAGAKPRSGSAAAAAAAAVSESIVITSPKGNDTSSGSGSGVGVASGSGSGSGTGGGGGGGSGGDGEDDFFFIAPHVSKRQETSNVDRQATQMTILTEIVTNKRDFDDMICDHCCDLLSKEFKSYDTQAQTEHAAFTKAIAAIANGEFNSTAPAVTSVAGNASHKLASTTTGIHSAANSVVSLHAAIPVAMPVVTDQTLLEDRRAERKLLAQLTALHADRHQLAVEAADVATDQRRMRAVQSEFWELYQIFQYQLNRFDERREGLRGALEFAESELHRMKHTRVAQDAFHIFTDESGKLGTINGLRLGMLGPGELPRGPVEWPEIGAALGQVALLCATIARQTNHVLSTYQFRIAGSFSRIEKRATPIALPATAASTTMAAVASAATAASAAVSAAVSSAVSSVSGGGGATNSATGGTHATTAAATVTATASIPKRSSVISTASNVVASGTPIDPAVSMELYWNGDLTRFNTALVRVLSVVRELTDRAGLHKLKDQFKPILPNGKIGAVSIQLATAQPCIIEAATPTASGASTPAGAGSTKSADGKSSLAAGGGGRARSSSTASSHGGSLTSPLRIALPPDHVLKCAGCRARKDWSRACKYLLIDLKLLLVVWSKNISHGPKYR